MIHSTMIRRSALAGLVLALALPVSQAMADDDPTEAKDFLASGMTVAQAATAAEAADTGTAMSVAWEPRASGTMGFAVELARADGSVNTVLVDPQDGKVTPWVAHADDKESHDEGERHHAQAGDEEDDD
ncbi:hypothetical protein [Modicisalibacter tunisiensis]|uniref:PepSY domain-containing protein n=1 Tax=Modicisalibacter tunisiensis TaxID=390637 RepID=A0ABS7X1A1_9GAMM|nr:hypothetical protein [Modicisalibacter tunisiensis]MBZ9538861.1 hypothetical protein [Modicisalibacter tunisiensis]MBZ9567731.1 hypothetical protein [Modicisalibacter tunisiensis]